MDRLDQLFQQFLRERAYLHNITPKTREFYETAWKAFTRAQREAPSRAADAPLLTRSDLQEFVIHLRQRGVKPVSGNCWMRGLNAFCRWLHQQGEIAAMEHTADGTLISGRANEALAGELAEYAV